MFTKQDPAEAKRYRLAIVGLSLLSVVALAIAIWTMIDSAIEQKIVQELIEQLPPSAKASARTLAGELKWQFRLTSLVVINLIATAIALALLWRAYRNSQASLLDAQALALNVVDSMEQAVITTDLQGNVTSINRRATELLKVEKKSVGHSLETARCADSAKRVSASVARRWRQKFIQGFTQRVRHRKPRLSANASSVLSNAQRSGGSENG